MPGSDSLRQYYREMSVVELDTFLRSYKPDEYEPDAREIIREVVEERKYELANHRAKIAKDVGERSQEKEKPKRSIGHRVSAGIGACVVALVVKALPGELLWGAIGGCIAGLLCGLVPYFLGKRRRTVLGVVGLWACMGLGAIGGALLAIPGAILFTVIILVRVPRERDCAARLVAEGSPPVQGGAQQDMQMRKPDLQDR